MSVLIFTSEECILGIDTTIVPTGATTDGTVPNPIIVGNLLATQRAIIQKNQSELNEIVGILEPPDATFRCAICKYIYHHNRKYFLTLFIGPKNLAQNTCVNRFQGKLVTIDSAKTMQRISRELSFL